MTRDLPPDRPDGVELWRTVIVVSLVGTTLVGVWLRWALAGSVSLAFPSAHLRHAHSHLGYFGLLFPLAWLAWRAAGAPAPGRRELIAYAMCTAVACVGFVHSGYGPVAIAGSTLVAAFWLWSAWPLRGRLEKLLDPLGAVPLGIVVSLACVPPIALTLRTNPDLAHGFVSTFLSGLLLVVIIPSTLASRRISPGPWPFFLVVGVLGALYLGVAPHPVTQLGLLAFAALMLAPVLSSRLALHERAAWALVGLGLGAMAIGLLPNVRPVALGAIHFLILGPVLASVAPLWLEAEPPTWAWWLGHACWGTMSAALVLQAFVADPSTWTVAALAGTATLLWWALVLVFSWTPSRDDQDRVRVLPGRLEGHLQATEQIGSGGAVGAGCRTEDHDCMLCPGQAEKGAPQADPTDAQNLHGTRMGDRRPGRHRSVGGGPSGFGNADRSQAGPHDPKP